jgi:hypothetical protein
MQITTADESECRVPANAASAETFGALVEPHRKTLLVHCYRLSGSLD